MLPPEIASGQGRLPKAMLIATLRQQPDGRGSGLQAGLCLHGIPVPDIDREGLCFPRGPCRGDLPQELQQKDEAGKLPAMFSGDQSQRRPGSDAARTAELTVLLTRGAPAAPTVKNTPAGLCVPGHVTSRAHKQIPSLEVTQTRAIPALSCLGTSRSTAGHLGPAPPPRTRSGKHKSVGAAQNWGLSRD